MRKNKYPDLDNALFNLKLAKLSFDLTTPLIIIVLIFVNSFSVQAQVKKAFTQRTSKFSPLITTYHINGDYTMIGNTNMTLQSYSDSKNNGSSNTMKVVDKDADAATSNSSSSTLNFSTENGASPTCSNILFAGLYWTARTDNDVTIDAKQKVKFKCPGQSAYQTLTANTADILFPGNCNNLSTCENNNIFSAYVEVTDLVRQYGLGEYWVADITLSTSSQDGIGWSGGWGMVIVYENSKLKQRDITVFDGFAFVTNSTTVSYDLPVSGFNTVLTGNVNMKLGMMASEGDVGYNGDYFKIKQNSNGNFLALSHPDNAGNTSTDYSDNFFSSTIYTGGNARNPNLPNNTGIDINMFTIPNTNNNVIANNQTSTTFKYGSEIDTYVIFCMIMGVDAYRPEPEGVISNLNPAATIHPCDTVEYKLEIRNKGTEDIKNARIVIPMPYTAINYLSSSKIVYSPASSSTEPYYDPSLGAAGSIVWDFGTLPKSADPNTLLAELKFKLGVSCDCNVLRAIGCTSPDITVDGTISGVGASTNVAASSNFILGFVPSGICAGTAIHGPLTSNIDAIDYINSHCFGQPIREFTFCNAVSTIPVTDLIGNFPLGARFYNEYPVTETSIEYTVSNPFPATTGSVTYYALPPAETSCYYKFIITVANFTSTPSLSASPLTYCQNEAAAALTANPTNTSYTLYYYSSNSSSATPQLELIPSTATVGSTTYYVAEGNGSSCISPNKIPLTVTVNPLPQAPIEALSDRNNFCPNDNGNISLSAIGGSGTTLNWFNGSCGATSIGNASPITIASPEENTTYYVRWENSCGNSNCAQIMINVTDNTNPLISCVPDQLKCVNTVNNTYKVFGIEFDASSFSDNCSVSELYNNINNSSTLIDVEFPLGQTLVIWTVKDASGNSASCSFSISVQEPPVITSEPVDLIKLEGEPASFSVTATGNNLTYQWQENNINLTNTGVYSDVFTNTLNISDVTGLNGNHYRCIVSGSCSPVTSDAALLTVTPKCVPPLLSKQPIGSTQCQGTNKLFDVIADGTPPFNYQWRKNGVKILGASKPQLSIINCQPSHSGNYSCVVTNSCGAIVSNIAVLVINSLPAITLQPIGSNVCPNADVSFSVSATGYGTLNYQWYKNGSNIISATNSQLSIVNCQLADEGGYSCIISNSCGNITSNPAVLVVNSSAVINIQPLSQSVCPDSDIFFSVSASGSAPLSYQWTKNNSIIPTATTSQYAIRIAQSADAANYSCIITNICSSITTNPAALVIKTLPSITLQPQGMTACLGSDVSFLISAAGSNPLSYQWQKDGINIIAASNSQFSIVNCQLTDSVSYSCIVSNSCGVISSDTANLVINTPPSITTQPLSQTVCQSADVSFSLSAIGSQPLNYQWRKDNTDILDSTNSQLSIVNCQLSDQGSYSCNVSNFCGNVSAASLLIVNTPPVILNTISNQSRCEGFDISFTINASGYNVSYQWTKSGVNIVNATSSVLTLTELKQKDGDIYSCNLSNACGSVNLKPFLLFIDQKPRINTIPITQIKSVGDSVSYYLNPQGTAPFTYQWIKDNIYIIGATIKTYEVKYLSLADSGHYNCIVNNVCGSSTIDISTLHVKEITAFKVSGSIKYDNFSSTPMSNTLVYLKNLEGSILDSAVTNIYGAYVFEKVENGTYNISCKTTMKWGGADPTDALIINKYFVKLATFKDDLMQAAADVNADGRINPTDALLISKRFIMIINSFKAGDWLFDNSTIYVYNADFVGNIRRAICIGDVNGSYSRKGE